MQPQDPTPGVFHLKLESFNVEFQHYSDPETVEAVGSNDADLISLQEVTPEWEVVLRERYADTYPHMLFQSAPNSGGLAVLSRFPITDQGFHPGPNGWHPAWHVSVSTPQGTMQLLNIHLRSPLTGRDNSVEAFLQTGADHLQSITQFSDGCLQGLPTIVMGDFNEGVDGEAVRFLEDQGFSNALPLFHPGQGTWRHRSLGGQLNSTFDHILFNDAFAPLNAWVTVSGNSDHLPVVAHLEVTSNW